MNSQSRRRFLKVSSSSFLSLVFTTGFFSSGRVPAFGQGETNGLDKKAWMAKLMKDPKLRASDSPLHLGRFREPMYFLLDPIAWAPNSTQAGQYPSVTVPKGFVTDLASIPRAFWSLLRPDGIYAYAAIIHDYLYWTQISQRQTADEIIKQSMADFEIDSKTVGIIYTAIRAGGQAAWDENSRRRTSGEKRVLKDFPPNARTPWDVWRRRADVFIP